MPVSKSTLSSNLGRHVFGAAALAFGLITLAWQDYNGWHLSRYVVYPAAAAEIVGGAAIQFRRTAKTGAGVLFAVYLLFALRCVPQIFATPQIYNSWGNFFEQFSLVTGAAIVYARLSSPWSRETLNRIGRILLGICAASFTLEQAIYLGPTATLVPKWLPPIQMFWAVTTTVLFALAAVALLTNRMALLATRLLTMMLVIFGLLVWVPLLLSDTHNHTSWSETAETVAIAGTAWILADLLGEYRLNDHRPR
jgi:putative oxidoreductase